jgi:hypothetical protein
VFLETVSLSWTEGVCIVVMGGGHVRTYVRHPPLVRPQHRAVRCTGIREAPLSVCPSVITTTSPFNSKLGAARLPAPSFSDSLSRRQPRPPTAIVLPLTLSP